MNKKIIFIYLLEICISQKIYYFNDLNKNTNNNLNGIYIINSISNNLYLSIQKNILVISNKKSHFRLKLIKSNIYYLEHRGTKKRIGVDNKNNLKIYKTNNNKLGSKIFWKIIRINNMEFLIQNQFNNKFIEVNNNFLQCLNIIEFDINNKNKKERKNFIFKFSRLFKEGNLQKIYLKFINKEPVDILIKYIDLSDKNLKRSSIKQIYKDFDNQEIKYSLRSVFQYIPWIRKIFILMPNEIIKSFKCPEEIEDKIIYIKDRDLLGFDSANIHAFTFNLYKMENFSISKNFLYMEDDFFYGKNLKKYDFFYYDENHKKVVPYLLTFFFHELNRTNILEEYYNTINNIISIHPHSDEGWKFSILSTKKFFMEKYNYRIINTKFTHNSIAENIEDLKIIFEEIQDYQYINETLFSKERHILTLNQPHFYNLYLLNIMKRNVHSIPYTYIPIELINKCELNQDLFVLNTGGNHIPSKRHYKLQKKVMQKRFPIKTIYEKKSKENKISINALKNNYTIFNKLFLIFDLIKIYIILKNI